MPPEGARCGLEILRRELGDREPLSDDAAGTEVLRSELEVLRRVEIASPPEPGVNRIRRDDIEPLTGGHQEVSPVVEDDAELRTLEAAVVVRRDGTGDPDHL